MVTTALLLPVQGCGTSPTTRHQLRTIQTATKNVSVWD